MPDLSKVFNCSVNRVARAVYTLHSQCCCHFSGTGKSAKSRSICPQRNSRGENKFFNQAINSLRATHQQIYPATHTYTNLHTQVTHRQAHTDSIIIIITIIIVIVVCRSYCRIILLSIHTHLNTHTHIHWQHTFAWRFTGTNTLANIPKSKRCLQFKYFSPSLSLSFFTAFSLVDHLALSLAFSRWLSSASSSLSFIC